MPTQWMNDNDAYPPEWCLFYRAMIGKWNGTDFENVETCEAGVRYHDVRVLTDHYHYPCFASDINDPALRGKLHCAKMQYPTKEQVERYETESRKKIELFMKELESDICPHCHQPVKKYRQVGRCVYGEPCGHRLYKGKVPKRKAKAQP